jgi:hypothetical protein
VDVKARPLAPPKVRRQKLFSNEPAFDLRTHSIPDFRSGPDSGAGYQCLDCAHNPVRNRTGHLQVPQCRGVCVLAGTMPTQRYQRRQGVKRENAPREQSSGSGISNGGERAVPQPVRVGRFLPPHACQTRALPRR